MDVLLLCVVFVRNIHAEWLNSLHIANKHMYRFFVVSSLHQKCNIVNTCAFFKPLVQLVTYAYAVLIVHLLLY